MEGKDIVGRSERYGCPNDHGLIPQEQSIDHPEPTPYRPWGFWSSVGLTLVIFIASIIAQGLVMFGWLRVSAQGRDAGVLRSVESNGLLLALATCASVPVVVGLAWLFAKIRAGEAASVYLGFRSVEKRVVIRWGIVFLVFISLSDGLTTLLGRPIVPSFMVNAYKSAGFVPLFWLSLVVAAPIAEETLFRGFLFEGLVHSRVGAISAILVSSTWWALIHMQYDAYGIATIFAGGLLLAYARLRTGSIYATMCLHGLMNLVATIEAALVVRT